jgi:phage terminase small subunit
MRQRGKKSAANLSVLPVENIRHELQPPDHLSASEQDLFREVLANAPATQFSFSDQYLLATFCQITGVLREQARRVQKAKRENRAAELKMLIDTSKAQAMIATKLRLTTSARTASHVISRAQEKHKPSAYDLLREKGWE